MVKEINSLPEFDAFLSNAKGKLVVVDFFAVWCGPCKAIAPAIEKMESDLGGSVLFCKVDVEKASAISSRYEVRSMPTFKLFSDGNVVDEVIGANKGLLESKIAQHASSSTVSSATIDKALGAISSHPNFDSASTIVAQLVGNILFDTREAKYRRIRTTNEKLQKDLFSVPGVFDLFLSLGWSDEGEFLSARQTDQLTYNKWRAALAELQRLRAIRGLPPAPERAYTKPAAGPSSSTPQVSANKASAINRANDLKAEKERIKAEMKSDREQYALRHHGAQDSVALSPEDQQRSSRPSDKNVKGYSSIGVDLNKPKGCSGGSCG